jgi:hypothetical protein
MAKSTKKFLRMKAFLGRVMSPEAAWRHRLKLEDWRDCQALIACGFKVVGSSSKGTYFEMAAFSSALKDDMERKLCLKK